MIVNTVNLTRPRITKETNVWLAISVKNFLDWKEFPSVDYNKKEKIRYASGYISLFFE